MCVIYKLGYMALETWYDTECSALTLRNMRDKALFIKSIG